MTDDERERVWAAVHGAIGQMPGWVVGPCSYPGEEERWHVAVIDVRPRGRLAKAGGDHGDRGDRVAALEALVALLEARLD